MVSLLNVCCCIGVVGVSHSVNVSGRCDVPKGRNDPERLFVLSAVAVTFATGGLRKINITALVAKGDEIQPDVPGSYK